MHHEWCLAMEAASIPNNPSRKLEGMRHPIYGEQNRSIKIIVRAFNPLGGFRPAGWTWLEKDCPYFESTAIKMMRTGYIYIYERTSRYKIIEKSVSQVI